MYTNIHCSTVYNSKDLESTQMPIDDRWIGKMWHIYTMEYYAAIRNDEFVSFVEIWMNLENIILSKPTQEQKTKHRIFSLISGWWKMRTHGHREKSTKQWGLLGGNGEGQWEVEVGRDSLGRNAKCGWRGERKQNTLPCMYLCNCLACSGHVPPNLKCSKKFKKTNIYYKKKNTPSLPLSYNAHISQRWNLILFGYLSLPKSCVEL